MKEDRAVTSKLSTVRLCLRSVAGGRARELMDRPARMRVDTTYLSNLAACSGVNFNLEASRSDLPRNTR